LEEWGEGSMLVPDSDPAGLGEAFTGNTGVGDAVEGSAEPESLESGFDEASEDGVELYVAFEGDAALGGTSGDNAGGTGVVGASPVYA
jgi:hypothetical protein